MASSVTCSAWPAWTVLAVVSALSACAPSNTCKMVRATDLPLDIDHHHLVTGVEINGQPARMMLDTGSDTTVLTRRSVVRLGLPEPMLTSAMVSGIGGSAGLSVLKTARFKLGDVRGRDLQFGVLEGDILGIRSMDGIVGMDLLSQADLDIDLPERKMILYRVVEGCGRPSVALGEPLYMLPMVQPVDELRVMIPVSITGRRLQALLDLGAPDTIIFRGAARRLGLDAAALAQDPAGFLGGIGPHAVRAHAHIVEPVTVGELTIRNMPAIISDERISGEEDMILGLDFFRRVHVWMSFSSHTLIMQFPPGLSPPKPS